MRGLETLITRSLHTKSLFMVLNDDNFGHGLDASIRSQDANNLGSGSQ